MAKMLGTPLRVGATTATRAKDSDRQDTCTILDNALNEGELSEQEHRERVRAATNAVTLGDLQALAEDLQTDRAPLPAPAAATKPKPLKSPKLSGWGVLAAAFVASVLLGVGIGWGPSTATPVRPWTSPPIREPSPTELARWC